MSLSAAFCVLRFLFEDVKDIDRFRKSSNIEKPVFMRSVYSYFNCARTNLREDFPVDRIDA